jgi:hypothetical protein
MPVRPVWDLRWPNWQWDSLSRSTSVFCCQYHSINASYSSSSTRYPYQKDKWVKQRKAPKANLFRKSWERWIEKHFPLVVKGSTTATPYAGTGVWNGAEHRNNLLLLCWPAKIFSCEPIGTHDHLSVWCCWHLCFHFFILIYPASCLTGRRLLLLICWCYYHRTTQTHRQFFTELLYLVVLCECRILQRILP